MAEPKSPIAGGGYKSPVNIGLPRSPVIADDQTFQEMLPIYNAIHLLNAYLDEIRKVLEGGDLTDPPDVNMGFMRSFWVEAPFDVEPGLIVSMRFGKVVKGVVTADSGYPKFVGMALTAAAPGEKFRYGVGPAIVEIPGFKADQYVWAPGAGESYAGKVFNEKPEKDEEGKNISSRKIGTCLMDDYVVILPNFVA